jgi:hypothetical protein
MICGATGAHRKLGLNRNHRQFSATKPRPFDGRTGVAAGMTAAAREGPDFGGG